MCLGNFGILKRLPEVWRFYDLHSILAPNGLASVSDTLFWQTRRVEDVDEVRFHYSAESFQTRPTIQSSTCQWGKPSPQILSLCRSIRVANVSVGDEVRMLRFHSLKR